MAFEDLSAKNLVLNSRDCMVEFQCSEVMEGQEINCHSGLLDHKVYILVFMKSRLEYK